jgi:hypothetical protein
MFTPALLEFRNYNPEILEPGMFFMGITYDKQPIIYKLKHYVNDKELYVSLNGYPVEPVIVSMSNPNLQDEQIIAHPEQIGWFDEGDDCDELRDIEIEDFNRILQDYEGVLYVEMHDDEEIPFIFDNKITIRYAEIDNFEEETD